VNDWARDPGDHPPIVENPAFPPTPPGVGWSSGLGTQVSTPPPAPQPSVVTPPLEPTRRRIGPIVGALVGALALFFGGFLVGRITSPDTAVESGRQADDQPISTTQDSDRVGQQTASSDENGQASSAPPPTIAQSDEPVADIARAVGPAVVQLDTNSGLGSGFVYDESGLIMTAAHVVEGSTTLRVRLADGTRLEGSVVGTDPNSDVAVVRISEPPSDLVVASLALDDAPEPGDLAVAIGSPFGLDQTVTSGIVSAVNRPVPIGDDGRAVGMVQTDAAINSGNSGGALLNRQGQVIGINDSIRTLTGTNEGVGFAIPIDLAFNVAEALAVGDTPQLPTLGVFGNQNPPTFGQAGALIERVVEASGAEAAGLVAGDLIIAVDGSPIKDFSDLGSTLRTRKPGDTVQLTVVRDGLEFDVDARLG